MIKAIKHKIRSVVEFHNFDLTDMTMKIVIKDRKTGKQTMIARKINSLDDIDDALNDINLKHFRLVHADLVYRPNEVK